MVDSLNWSVRRVQEKPAGREPAGVVTLDAWIKKHDPDLSRPEAIRRLVELGLKTKGK
jgi:hypothetical protein